MFLPNSATKSLSSRSSSTAVVFAEIIPIVFVATDKEADCIHSVGETQLVNHHQPQQHIPLTNFGVKHFLLGKNRKSDFIAELASSLGIANGLQFFIQWKGNDDTNASVTLSSGHVFQNEDNEIQDLGGSTSSCGDQRNPSVYIPSDNPTIIDRQPCYIIAYACNHQIVGTNQSGLKNYQGNFSKCHFSRDTLIRILPPRLVIDRPVLASVPLVTTSDPSLFNMRRESILSEFVEGESGNFVSGEMIKEVLQNHNEKTVQELSLKMSAAMMSIKIGTTCDAFHVREKQEKQMRKIEQSIRASSGLTFQKETNLMRGSSISTGLQSWPSLIVHSPNHADGKTLLVQSLAKRLGCSLIRLIRPGALLAKYSVGADSALESQLHAILVGAACQNQKVCIILDQLDMMLPPRLSGRTSSGDPALPTFNSIASYLRKLTDSIQRKRQFPFPSKNSLYNPTSYAGTSGQVFSVKFCLVGIVTCPDDGWKSHQKSNNESAGGCYNILDCMIGDRYRIPLLTTKTIISAFNSAFANEGVKLGTSTKVRLESITKFASWVRGSVFRRVAKQLKWILTDGSLHGSDNNAIMNEATIQDLEKAFALVKQNVVESVKVKNSIKTETPLKINKPQNHFGSIGGNEHATMSLEDALAFDLGKREMLAKFGLSPPTGVLLYGPPGCGKTLLAKAVAGLYKNPASGPVQSLTQGLTFVALSISEIVSSEIGTSEKTIASSFEFAEKHSPSVIFLDEFQALFTDRNQGGSGKLTTTLLQCLDDVKRWCEIDLNVKGNQTATSEGRKRVVVIAATNTPWMIDCAFLRPGRFDRVVHVGLPCRSERKSILQVHIKRMRVREDDNVDTFSKLCEDLSILTEGFSGADIAALCRAAAVRALGQGEGASVEESHFEDAIKRDVFPSSDHELVKKLKMWRP